MHRIMSKRKQYDWQRKIVLNFHIILSLETFLPRLKECNMTKIDQSI